MQRMESTRQIMIRVGDAGEGEDAVLEALDSAPGDIDLAEVGERLAEELVLARHRRARFGDRLDERGEILRGEKVRVGATQTEMRLDDLDLAQRVHVASAGRLIVKIGEIKEIESPDEGTLGPRRALGHQREPSHLLAKASHDEARIAKRHPRDDEASGGLRFGHGTEALMNLFY